MMEILFSISAESINHTTADIILTSFFGFSATLWSTFVRYCTLLPVYRPSNRLLQSKRKQEVGDVIGAPTGWVGRCGILVYSSNCSPPSLSIPFFVGNVERDLP